MTDILNRTVESNIFLYLAYNYFFLLFFWKAMIAGYKDNGARLILKFL